LALAQEDNEDVKLVYYPEYDNKYTAGITLPRVIYIRARRGRDDS
jgi:hypothetical protein